MNVRVADRIGIGKGITGTVISGIGRMGGRNVVIARSFSSERRGALTHADGTRLAESADLAKRLRMPFVFIVASSGADVVDGVAALHGWGKAAAAIAGCSGIVPVLMAATGPVVSGPALLLGLADLVVMSAEAVAFVSGPQMVAEFTGVEVGLHELGGVGHPRPVERVVLGGGRRRRGRPGRDCSSTCPRTPTRSPPSSRRPIPTGRSTPELRDLIPERKSATYDVREVVRIVVDDGEFRELWPRWAGQIVTGFCRIGGISVGIVANQPRILAGTLDIAASQKAARFVRFCDSFNLPLVSLVDTPGFLPGKDLEWRGMIRHGAELAFAYAQATVPRVCLILRKAFGGAYIVMDSRGIGNDICLAWPAAEIAVMGASGAVQILHRGIDAAERGERESGYEESFLNPWPASERGLVDQVLDPADTRIVLASVLRQLCTKREHSGGPKARRRAAIAMSTGQSGFVINSQRR